MPQNAKLRLLLALLLPAALLADDPTSLAMDLSAPILVKVHRKVLHRIDPRLFGQFLERPSWHGEIGAEAALVPGTHKLRPAVKDLICRMQIPLVRFPGGIDVEHLDWLDMIDNVPGRAGGRPLSIGHKGDPITNNFGYDEFLRLCEEIEMVPLLVVNFRDGVLAADGPERAARHAAKLVAYCNAEINANLPEEFAAWPRLRAANGHPAPYRVPYFQIGNETWNYTSGISEDAYLAALQAYIKAIHTVDPSARLIVDGTPAKLARRIHEKFGHCVSYFALHYYQPGPIRNISGVDIYGPTVRDYWYAWVTVPQIDSMGQSVLLNSEIAQARTLGYRIAVTEWNWNGWWAWLWTDIPVAISDGQIPFDSLFAKGIGAAGILHALMRQGDVIAIATQSMLIGDNWDIHAIFADRYGQIPPYQLPTGQVTALYSKHHGRDRLEVEVVNMSYYEQPYGMGRISPVSRVAYLDILATRDASKLFLHAINRHFDQNLAVQFDISELEKQPAATGSLHILEGRLDNEPQSGASAAPGWIKEMTFPVPGSRFQLRLPARTVTVVEVPLQQG